MVKFFNHADNSIPPCRHDDFYSAIWVKFFNHGGIELSSYRHLGQNFQPWRNRLVVISALWSNFSTMPTIQFRHAGMTTSIPPFGSNFSTMAELNCRHIGIMVKFFNHADNSIPPCRHDDFYSGIWVKIFNHGGID